jgi:hypothetical protein
VAGGFSQLLGVAVPMIKVFSSCQWKMVNAAIASSKIGTGEQVGDNKTPHTMTT